MRARRYIHMSFMTERLHTFNSVCCCCTDGSLVTFDLPCFLQMTHKHTQSMNITVKPAQTIGLKSGETTQLGPGESALSCWTLLEPFSEIIYLLIAFPQIIIERTLRVFSFLIYVISLRNTCLICTTTHNYIKQKTNI